MCFFFFIFFFKQKTAYEMRISDWSSDVCSSDLTSAWIIGRSALHHVDIFNRDGPTVAEIGDKDCKADGGLARRHRQHEHREHQIGRASCRERVCQYV